MFLKMRKKDWKDQFEAEQFEEGHLIELISDYQDTSPLAELEGLPFIGFFPPNWEENGCLFASDGEDIIFIMGCTDTYTPLASVLEGGSVDTKIALEYYRIRARAERILYEIQD